MVDNKRLDELMLEKYPHIVYTAEQSDEFLKNFSGDLENESEDVIVYNFKEYVNRAEKFIIIKTIGKHDNFVVREFDSSTMRNQPNCLYLLCVKASSMTLFVIILQR